MNEWTSEEHTLGAMMISPSALDAVLETLEPHGEEKFTRDNHRVIYRAMRAMVRAGHGVDPVALPVFLEAHKALVRVGGEQRIQELATLVYSATNATHHAKLVREAWAKREVEALAVYPDKPTAVESLEVMERSLMDVRARIEEGNAKAFFTAYELAEAHEAHIKNPVTQRGVPTPFRTLDPLCAGQLHILSGYTGDGKTVAAVEYAKTACKNRFRVGFWTIEMSHGALFQRFLASFGVPLSQIQSGNVSATFKRRHDEALAEVSTWQFDVYDSSASNSATIRRAQRLRRYDLIVVDHLHEIMLEGRASEHRRLLEDETRRLLHVAKEHEVPILLLAQLSRPSNNTSFPAPTLTMLRETGRIEQEAHSVVFIWRERDKQNQPTNEAWLIVGKNRDGRAGYRRPLDFIGDQVRFVEADREDVG